MTDIKTIAADASTVLLDIANELREHPENFTQGALRRDSRGESALDDPQKAVCWCLVGHIDKRTLGNGRLDNEVRYALSRQLMADGEGDCIPTWNDDPDRTVADVIELCERVAGTDPTPCPQCHATGAHKRGCELL